MSKENKFETGQESIENVQNLLQKLLLAKDIESEYVLLEKYGIDVNKKDLEAFHKQKEKFFTFVKENKDELLKLTMEELEYINSGNAPLVTLTYRQLATSLGKGAASVIGPYLHQDKNIATVIFDAVLGSVVANVLCYFFVDKPNADVFADVSSKLGSYSNSKKTNANKKS